MTLKEYIEGLQIMLTLYPEAESYEVVYSTDDEGNYFKAVCYTPSVGILTDDGEFGDYNPEKRDSVCIN